MFKMSYSCHYHRYIMVITIKKGTPPKQVKKIVSNALKDNWNLEKQKKETILDKLGGLLARLKMTPLEIQKEMRDGWL